MIWARINSPVPTSHTTWPNVSGGFIQYGVNEHHVNYLVLSQIPVNEAGISSHGWGNLGLSGESLIINPQGGHQTEIRLGRQTRVIMVTEEGRVVSEICPIGRDKFQAFLDDLEKAPIEPNSHIRDVISPLKKFIVENEDISWPPWILQALDVR